MAATPEQRRAFGARLAELRTAKGWTQPAVCELLPEHGGKDVTVPAYSQWETGGTAPDARTAAALESIFGEPHGALAGLLGYRGDDPSTLARLDAIEAIVADLADGLTRLAAQVERLSDE